MSILIKGMKMPESCLNCPLETDYGTCGHFNGADYAKYQTEYNSRPVWCPLVELQPHGRLIDADALLRRITFAETNQPEIADVYVDDYIIVRDWLHSAPTIFEAEEGEQ